MIFDESGTEIGATQTHDEASASAGEMVRGWAALMFDVTEDEVDVVLL